MKREMLAACVVSACGATLLAQDTLPYGGEIVISPSQVISANPPLRTGFGARALATVYDNQTNLLANGSSVTVGFSYQILEDVSFEPGPWGSGYAGDRVISSISWGAAVMNSPTSANEQMFLTFWNPADVNFNGFNGSGTSMIRPGAVPIASVTVNPGTTSPGFVYSFSINSLNISLPASLDHIVLQAGWAGGSCPTTGDRGMVFGSNTLAGPGGNPASIGATLPDYAADSLSGVCCDNVGTFIGRPLGDFSSCNEHRGSSASIQRGFNLLIAGDVAAPVACDPDINQDGAADQGDVDYLINVIAGGENPNNATPDFNNDGASDQGDIDALINVVAGGQCP